MTTVDHLYAASLTPADFGRAYAEALTSLLHQIDYAAISTVIDTFLAAREAGKRIYFIGNGGSAATASHFANDLALGTKTSGKPFKAVSLTDNNAVMTAIANDEGYEHLFARQLDYLVEDGDVVVAISASGNSPNVVRAVELANARGNHTIGLVGFDGGKLGSLCRTIVHVRTALGEYGPVEDVHLILDHLITGFLRRRCAAVSGTTFPR